MKCPKCGYRPSTGESWGRAIGATTVAVGVAGTIGFLFGGPVGAAIGGGFLVFNAQNTLFYILQQ